MSEHVVDLQTQIQAAPDGEPTGAFRYRWRCSCGEQGRRWYSSNLESGSYAAAARAARNAGVRHMATSARRP